ncbi:MAG: amidohydrolase family protein [Treponema sp.]|nr:amidohydrolase family protein [Treponema sp.]
MIVRNGLAALPGRQDFVRASLRVRGERIADIVLASEDPDGSSLVPEAGEEVVEASGLLVLPGAIDPHVHFDEPGFTHREDFLHGTMEAAKGGVTTVIDMPCTSLPPVTDLAALRNKLAVISSRAVVDYALYGGVSGRGVEASLGGGGKVGDGPGGKGRAAPGAAPGAMAELAAAGVVGFKCYFISGMETFTRVTHDDFGRILAEGERIGRPVLLHAEDLDYVTAASARLASARGSAAPEWSDYVQSRPEAAELVACASALALASGRESSLHVVHVGTAAAAELLHRGGASCETCSHYLAFSSEDFAEKGAALKTAPVVKGRAEREKLWRLLADGTIDFVTSDHAPSPESEKNTGNVLTAYGGIPGTGTVLPYLLSEGLFAGRLSLPRFLDAISGSAARRYGLWARKGSLAAGKDADLVLVDPAGTWRVEGSRLLSKGKITPFEGMDLTGRVLATYVRGHRVYDAGVFDARGTDARGTDGGSVSHNRISDGPGILAEPGSGKFLAWGYR